MCVHSVMRVAPLPDQLRSIPSQSIREHCLAAVRVQQMPWSRRVVSSDGDVMQLVSTIRKKTRFYHT
ncbi:hypothetical protein BD414DRAFT_481506 [Trametes punicea]|nr:hypothetical protein BD414DRAFT_481506 [Trametes punicea]